MEGWYKIGHFWEQNQFNRPQMVQFECPWPWVTNPLVSFTLEEFPFPIFCPCSSLPSFLTLQYKEMVYYGRLGKKVDFFWNKISLTGGKWSNLIALGSYTFWCHPLLKYLSSFVGAPFLAGAVPASALRQRQVGVALAVRLSCWRKDLSNISKPLIAKPNLTSLAKIIFEIEYSASAPDESKVLWKSESNFRFASLSVTH